MANHPFGLSRFNAKIERPAWSACNDSAESWADAKALLSFKVTKSSRMAKSRRPGLWFLARRPAILPDCAGTADLKATLEKGLTAGSTIGSNDEPTQKYKKQFPIGLGCAFTFGSAQKAELPRGYNALGIEVVDLRVECCAGRKADERPIRFWLGDKQHLVQAILDQWYDPESIFYKVRADDGNVYILRQQTSRPEGRWDLISFRQTTERQG